MPSSKKSLPKTLIFVSFILAFLSLSYFLYSQNLFLFAPQTNLNPDSQTAEFIKKLNFSLHQASLTVSGPIETYQSKKIVTFRTTDNVRVIFSLEKDPYFQVASLQQIFKTARMNTKQVEKVDLSLKKPYVTFKDN
jgi:hypothetical protein